jgi:hypothetical protein
MIGRWPATTSAGSGENGSERRGCRHTGGHGLQVIVNRMRLRFRLNERRMAELLRGIDRDSLGDNFAATTAGLLACLGDVAALSFTPVYAGTGVCLSACVCAILTIARRPDAACVAPALLQIPVCEVRQTDKHTHTHPSQI